MNDLGNKRSSDLDIEAQGPSTPRLANTDERSLSEGPPPSRLLLVGLVSRHELAPLQQRPEYEVEIVLYADAARTAFERFRPDLVVISQDLPDGSWAKLAAFIRKRSPTCLLFLLAGAVDAGSLLQAMRSGINDVLTRPFSVEHLEQCGARIARLFPDAESLSPVLDRRIAQLVGVPVPTVERALIQHTLTVCRGNRVRAARLLGLPRRTLYHRLGQYGLDSPQPERVAANAKGDVHPHR